jgi:hypothetical protein
MNKKPYQDQGTLTDKLRHVFPCRTHKRYFPAVRKSGYAAIKIIIHVLRHFYEETVCVLKAIF